MAKDPVCGMDVAEEGALNMLHFEHETIYFCSEQCKDAFGRKIGLVKPATKKGFVRRLLEKIARGTESSFGGQPPKCH